MYSSTRSTWFIFTSSHVASATQKPNTPNTWKLYANANPARPGSTSSWAAMSVAQVSPTTKAPRTPMRMLSHSSVISSDRYARCLASMSSFVSAWTVGMRLKARSVRTPSMLSPKCWPHTHTHTHTHTHGRQRR